MSRTEQLSDFDERAVSAAEADLERLLSIQPSPDFAVKVRARIAAEPAVRSWSWGRLVLPLAAVAALVLVVALATSWRARDAEGPFTATRQSDIVLIAARPNEATAVVSVTPAIVSKPPVRRATAPSQREPEVIIDPAIADAIRRLAVAARNTALDASKGESIAAPNAESDTLAVAEPLNLPELVLKPADQTGGQ